MKIKRFRGRSKQVTDQDICRYAHRNTSGAFSIEFFLYSASRSKDKIHVKRFNMYLAL